MHPTATATTASDEREVASILNPFVALTHEPLQLHIPTEGGLPQDVYTWVAYFLDGDYVAEFDARGEASFAATEGRPVLALELIPITFDCAKHQRRANEQCPLCVEQWRRARLSTQRVVIPAGHRAVFFRRRFRALGDLPPGVEIVQNWTVVGFEKLDARVASVVGLDGQTLVEGGTQGSYVFYDESGRAVLTNDRDLV